MSPLILKRALGWNHKDYLLEKRRRGRSHLLPQCCRAAGPVLDVGQRPQRHGYEPPREAAMA
jgi:hypothetical protein